MKIYLARYFIYTLVITSLGYQPALGITNPPGETLVVLAKVDPRVELMSIVARLAGYQEYVQNDFKSYATDVDKYFEKYKHHPAIKFAAHMRETNGVGYDAVMSMAVHLNLPPALTPRIAFSADTPDKHWGKTSAEQFSRLLRQFYRDTHYESFFQSHAQLYDIAEQRFQQLLGKVNFDWYREFYGEVPAGTFNLYIGLLNGGGNYGPKVVYANGVEDLYAIIGTWQVDNENLPLYSDKNLPTIIHEFNHSFVNHLVDENKQQFNVLGEKIYPVLANKMQRLAYASWETVVKESLVRAAVIRYLFDNDTQPDAGYQELLIQQRAGFLGIDELVSLLGVYENARRSYPSLRSFIPMIEAYYKDLTKHVDYKIKNDNASKPHVIAMIPDINGSQDVDPNISKIVFIFDKPLDINAGYSINFGENGKEHYPVESTIGYNETGINFSLQVKLKPDWDYEFVLSDLVFRGKDGVHLLPYAVKFKTRKN